MRCHMLPHATQVLELARTNPALVVSQVVMGSPSVKVQPRATHKTFGTFITHEGVNTTVVNFVVFFKFFVAGKSTFTLFAFV